MEPRIITLNPIQPFPNHTFVFPAIVQGEAVSIRFKINKLGGIYETSKTSNPHDIY